MITRLFGVVADMEDSGAIVIDCRGVGYGVIVNDRDRRLLNARKGSEQLVFVRRVVKEPPEGEVLYGFVDVEDRRMFDRIVAVDGCGPAVAMKLLSTLAAGELEQMFKGQGFLTVNVKGVGPKTLTKLREAWS